MVRTIALVLFLGLLSLDANADKRVAFVVGNSAYQHTSRLANPKHDARDVSASLRALRFNVVEGFDLDKSSFDKKLIEFSRVLRGAEVGVFFYAGHGLQVGGQNYLVPVDAELASGSSLDVEMVRIDVVQRIMESETTTNIIFLDACRDNPLARNLARAMGTRSTSIGRGLASIEAGIGTLISFSTQPGNVAQDGVGRNSPYAEALVRHLAISDDDLSSILISVRNDVMNTTKRKQVPWEHSSLTGRFYFKGAPAPVITLREAERAWSEVMGSTSQAALEGFISRYGDTVYGTMARNRLEDLKRRQRAPLEPSASKTMITAKSPDHRFSPASSPWVKLCERATSATKDKEGRDQKKELDICMTHHERIDGSSGMVVVSAALQETKVEGETNPKNQFLIMVPTGMLQKPGLRATLFPKDLWIKVEKNEKIDKSEEARLTALQLEYTLCHAMGCTAETEATSELVGNLKASGGLMVFALRASGAPVAFPVPLQGFEKALVGPPVDAKKYGEARKALMMQITQRQQELAVELKDQNENKPPPIRKK